MKFFDNALFVIFIHIYPLAFRPAQVSLHSIYCWKDFSN